MVLRVKKNKKRCLVIGPKQGWLLRIKYYRIILYYIIIMSPRNIQQLQLPVFNYCRAKKKLGKELS